MKLTIKTILILLFSTNILHAEYINSDKQVKIQKELDSLKINNTIQKSITTEIEKQNKFFEEKFQLQKENLEYKNSRLDNWLNFIAIILTFFGIIIPVITFSFFTKARSEINKVKEDAGNNIQNFITEIKEKFNFYEKKASQTVENIETINEKITLFHEESTKPKSMVKEPTKSNTVDLEKEIINNRFEEVINDIDLNDLEKELTNALSLYLSDKYLEAKKLYENIIKNHFQELSTETLSLVYFNYAYCCEEINELTIAKDYYKKSLVLNPEFANAHNNLAVIYDKENDINKAITFYKNAIMYNPTDITYWENLGNLFGRNKKNKKAIKCYKKGLKIDPNSSSLILNIIESRIYLNQIEEAKKELTEIKKIPDANKFAILIFEIYFLTLENKWKKNIDETFIDLKQTVNNDSKLINWNFNDTINWLNSDELKHLEKKQKDFFLELINKINEWVK